MRNIIGSVALLVALGLVLGLVFGVFDGGSNTKKASTTTATTNTTPATTTTSTTTVPVTTTPASTTAAPATTTTSTTTTSASAPSTPSATPLSTTTTTGGGPIAPTMPAAGPAVTTSVVVTPPVIRLNVRPSAHGLVTTVQLLGPVTIGGSTPFDATVYKVSGPPLIAPAIAFGDEFNSRPTGNFAKLGFDPSVYVFADSAKNWFQLPAMKVGDVFNVHGTVEIRDRGLQANSYCLSATLANIPLNPSYDANGEPLPSWTELARPLACQRISFR